MRAGTVWRSRGTGGDLMSLVWALKCDMQAGNWNGAEERDAVEDEGWRGSGFGKGWLKLGGVSEGRGSKGLDEGKCN